MGIVPSYLKQRNCWEWRTGGAATIPKRQSKQKEPASSGQLHLFICYYKYCSPLFVPSPPFLLIATWALAKQKGRAWNCCLEAWERRKEQFIQPDWKEEKGTEGQRADPWLRVEWHKGGSHVGCGELRRNTGLISAGRTHGKKSRICYNRFNETSFGEPCLKFPNWEHPHLTLWKQIFWAVAIKATQMYVDSAQFLMGH